MKKQLLLLILMLLPMIASADAVEINGIYYNLIEKAKVAEVTVNPNKYSGIIVIPEFVNYKNVTYNVTSIGKSAFANCTDLTSVTISNSVISIDEYAFALCKNLTSIIIGNSVTSIGLSAFWGCESLISITFGNSVTSIGSGAFQMCKSLTSVTIPNSVISIDGYAFQNCISLATINIPNNVTSIGDYAFDNCSNLVLVSIPNSVTSIGNDAFANCNSLTSVKIGTGVTRINSNAFAHCTQLTEVYCYAIQVPKTDLTVFDGSYIDFATLYVPSTSVESYKATAPWNSFKEVLKISLPKHTLTYKVDGEIYKSYNIEEEETITPEAEPKKEGYTFSGWSEIPSTMPARDVTVTGTFTVNKYKLIYKVDGEVYKTYDIEYGATISPEAEPTKEGYKFSGWSYTPSKMPAEDVTVVGTFTQEAFVKDNVTYEMNGNDASVTHADNAKGEIVVEASVVINGKSYNVTSIADGAFQGCTGLTSIEIPATVTKIGENAFNGCSSLIVIKIGKDIKEIGSKAFANIGKSNARTRADIELRVYCEAEVLPSTAGDAFENSPIDKGTLYVNDDLIGVYKVVMPWNGFGTIVGLSTGIRSVSIDSEDAWIFDMQGNRIDNVRKGVNIIRTRDGKTKKIVVK